MDMITPARLTEAELCRWLGMAAPGDRLVYHRGFLAIDLDPLSTRMSERERAELRRVARRAMSFAKEGRAHLVQRRNGTDDFAYFLVARRREKPERCLLNAAPTGDALPARPGSSRA